MDIYQVSQIVPSESCQVRYHEIVRQPSLSAGVYVLPAGAHDPQQPHTEDELYYVVSGRATITVAGESQTVAAGSVVYVAAGVEHRFEPVTEDLMVLVFFAPAEYTRRAA
jgi:quercetin dioxygenase-like cupin family protein